MSYSFLAFRLAGPMASWGDVTVGDRRSSWQRPSSSALIGLIGAAMGIRRDDAEGQEKLSTLRFAIRLDKTGSPLLDYHTVQAPNKLSKGKRPFTSRRDELTRNKGKLNTKLTDRYYYCDQIVSVLCWGEGLDAIEKALSKPVFPLCLGRKACPPSRPLNPLLVKGESIANAFSLYDKKASNLHDDADETSMEPVSVFWDVDGKNPPPPGISESLRAELRDRPTSRGPDWTFEMRWVAQGQWEAQS